MEIKLYFTSQKIFLQSKKFNDLKKQVVKQLQHANNKQLKQYYRLNLIDKKTFKEYQNKKK